MLVASPGRSAETTLAGYSNSVGREEMKNHGVHHLGLARHGMEATLAFYEQALGEAHLADRYSTPWPSLAREPLRKEGGCITRDCEPAPVC